MTPPARALLRWYDRHGRADLPWRRRRSPYRTLVSEFMLQQTQVARVMPAFERFTKHFPTLSSLAAASTGDVLRAWRGLGYNARAVRLHAVARAIAARHGGRIPKDSAKLRALPGIGAYTAAAIRAFAYGLDDAPLDTNVRRIVHRLYYGIEHPSRAILRELNERAQTLLPRGRSHDWNSAIMDLGASLCTARAPQCRICPLRRSCAAAPIDASVLERARLTAKRSTRAAVPFTRTARYARGRIVDLLRGLPPGRRISLLDLHRGLRPIICDRTPDDLRRLVEALAGEGLVRVQDGEVCLP